jgi:hypothetical protein
VPGSPECPEYRKHHIRGGQSSIYNERPRARCNTATLRHCDATTLDYGYGGRVHHTNHVQAGTTKSYRIWWAERRLQAIPASTSRFRLTGVATQNPQLQCFSENCEGGHMQRRKVRGRWGSRKSRVLDVPSSMP